MASLQASSNSNRSGKGKSPGMAAAAGGGGGGDRGGTPSGSKHEKSPRRSEQIKLEKSQLPPRPVQPLRPICRYISEFIREKRGGGDTANVRQLLTQASRQWKELPVEGKVKYVDAGRDEWTVYFKNLQDWKNKMAEFKRPAPPYAHFMKDIWKDEMRGRRMGQPARSFTEVTKYASDVWSNKAYKRRYEEDRKKYVDKMGRLSETKMEQKPEIKTEPTMNATSSSGAKTAPDGAVGNRGPNTAATANPSVEDMDVHGEGASSGNPLNPAQSTSGTGLSDASFSDDDVSSEEYQAILAEVDAVAAARGDGHGSNGSLTEE